MLWERDGITEDWSGLIDVGGNNIICSDGAEGAWTMTPAQNETSRDFFYLSEKKMKFVPMLKTKHLGKILVPTPEITWRLILSGLLSELEESEVSSKVMVESSLFLSY